MANFEFIKGNIEVVILNSLYQNDRYGYEIAKEIKEKTENAYEIKQPTLYAYLKRLESGGLIASYWGEESSGGRRRYYKLTDEGKAQCETFLSEWKYHKNVMESLVADDTNIEEISQNEATTLLGSKIKRQKREERALYFKEQQDLSAQLEQLVASKEKNAQLAAENNETRTEKINPTQEAALNDTLRAVTARTEMSQSSTYQKSYKRDDTMMTHNTDSTNAADNNDAIFSEEEQNYISNGTAASQDTVTKEKRKGLFGLLRSNSKKEKRQNRSAARIEKKNKKIAQSQNAFYINSNDGMQASGLIEADIEDVDMQDEAPQTRINANASKKNADEFFEEFNKKAQQIIDRNKSAEAPIPDIYAYGHGQSQNLTNQPQGNNGREENETNYKHVLGAALEKQLKGVEAIRKVPQSVKESSVIGSKAEINSQPETMEELVDNFTLQGVKVRLYNKLASSYVPQTMLYKNRLNLLAAWFTYITFAFATLLVWLGFKDSLNATYATAFVLIPALFPIVFLVLFFINPAKKIAPKFDFKYHLINTIIAFALITLLTFTLFMLLGGVFSDKTAVLTYIVLPIMAAACIPLYVLFYKLIFKKALI